MLRVDNKLASISWNSWFAHHLFSESAGNRSIVGSHQLLLFSNQLFSFTVEVRRLPVPTRLFPGRLHLSDTFVAAVGPPVTRRSVAVRSYGSYWGRCLFSLSSWWNDYVWACSFSLRMMALSFHSRFCTILWPSLLFLVRESSFIK